MTALFVSLSQEIIMAKRGAAKRGNLASKVSKNGSSGNMAGMGGKKSSFTKGAFKGKTP